MAKRQLKWSGIPSIKRSGRPRWQMLPQRFDPAFLSALREEVALLSQEHDQPNLTLAAVLTTLALRGDPRLRHRYEQYRHGNING